MPRSHPIHPQGSQARFEAMFDHQPMIDTSSPAPLPYRTQVRRALQ